MAYITLAEVKTYLGISVTTYDSVISSLIPETETTVKSITRNKYTVQIKGDILAASVTTPIPVFVPVSIYSGGSLVYDMMDYIDLTLDDCLHVGQLINGTGITSGAFISDIYSDPGSVIDGVTYGTPVFTISGTVTAGDDVTAITGIPVGLKKVIADGIWWLIGQRNQTLVDTAWTSKSVGPLTISRSSSDNAIDGQYGMPAWFVKSFLRFH